LTAIINLRGTYAFPVGLTYRYSDSLLFDVKYVALAGGFFQTASSATAINSPPASLSLLN